MDDKLLIKNISKIGHLLLKNGAEIYRVEESIERMCIAYGFKDICVFALPTYFSLSVTLKDGEPYTITKRTTQNRTNLDNVYQLNNLVRAICVNQPSNKLIEKEINKIEGYEANMPLVFLGYGLGAGGFCVFFGGGLYECIASIFIGFIMYFFIWLCEIVKMNALMRTMMTSFIVTFFATRCYNFNMIRNLNATIIGCLMILTPGIAITNSLKDIIDGNTVSGQARFFEAFFIATAIAAGVGIAHLLMGGVL